MTFDTPLTPDLLCRRTGIEAFSFETTADLPDPTEMVGQSRAAEAVRFGIGMRHQGYNLFVLGPSGMGKHRMVHEHLREAALAGPVPPDCCYVHNFDEPHKPRVLLLPAGAGAGLRADMDNLVQELRGAIPAAFESDDYRARRQAVDEVFKGRQEHALEEVHQAAQEGGVALVRTPMGFAFAPAANGDVMMPDQFRQLPKEEQDAIQQRIEGLQGRLQEALSHMPQWEKEHRQQVRALNEEVTRFAVSHLIGELREKHGDLAPVRDHLDAVEKDVIANVDQFLQQQQQGGMPGAPPPGMDALGTAAVAEVSFLRRYRINVVVDNGTCPGAPVVHEDHPTYDNLIGRIEHIAQFGALATDFNLIKAGALLRANGGYLVVDAGRLLAQPYAWDELKRTLRAREIRIGSIGQMYSLIATVSLEPEPVPLDAKIVLVGDRYLYYLLSAYDPEFAELFKVAADFEDEIDRTPAHADAFARVVAAITRADGLMPFDRSGVGRTLDRMARLAGDSGKLSAHVRSLADLAREADHFARGEGASIVTGGHVERAIAAQEHRLGRVRDRAQEEIAGGTYLIDTAGAKVGQVNGLSVSQIGSFAFGRPTRITARVRMGRGGVVDIERESKLGGPIHTKGVMILSGYLGQQFLPDKPLSLSASLVFEQSYGGVEGDSASLAELCTLLSALAEVPISQSFAMTGSVNQHGDVQAIGGANEKIEGFFDVCRARGATDGQGVLIPASNVRHLMLREDVVEAAAAGTFRIFAVERVEQAVELLTGLPAGERGADGRFPEGSVFARVERRLADMAEAAKAFGTGDGGKSAPSSEPGS